MPSKLAVGAGIRAPPKSDWTTVSSAPVVTRPGISCSVLSHFVRRSTAGVRSRSGGERSWWTGCMTVTEGGGATRPWVDAAAASATLSAATRPSPANAAMRTREYLLRMPLTSRRPAVTCSPLFSENGWTEHRRPAGFSLWPDSAIREEVCDRSRGSGDDDHGPDLEEDVDDPAQGGERVPEL